MEDRLPSYNIGLSEPTNTGLLLHYQSHIVHKYTRSLLSTTLNRGYRLSSSWELFINECENLERMFLNLKYPSSLIDSTITTFVDSLMTDQQYQATIVTQADKPVRIILPLKIRNQPMLSGGSWTTSVENSGSAFNRSTPVQKLATHSNFVRLSYPWWAKNALPTVLNDICVIQNIFCSS